MQCSAGKRRLRSNPCRTERMLGRWTNCSTKRWLWNRQSTMHLAHHNICYTHPQHCTCLNITVLYPTLHQYKHCYTVLAQTSLLYPTLHQYKHCTWLNITVLYPTLHQYKHCNLHSSKRWQWFGWCYGPPCTHPSGREVCGMTCSLPAQC